MLIQPWNLLIDPRPFSQNIRDQQKPDSRYGTESGSSLTGNRVASYPGDKASLEPEKKPPRTSRFPFIGHLLHHFRARPEIIAPPPIKAQSLLEGVSAPPKRYLNILWNQHQPDYKDDATDSFREPWVRLHATKDYYSMAANLLDFPDVHVTINLSSSLLSQLDEYVQRLAPYADPSSLTFGQIDAYPGGRLEAYPAGKLDRYLDLTMKPVDSWSKEDKEFALQRFFDADVRGQIAPFDGYRYLYDKKKKGEAFTDQDYRDLKVWFNLSWMDASFQEGEATLKGLARDGSPVPDEKVSSTWQLVKKGREKGYGNGGFTEADARDLVVDQYKIMKYVIPVHRLLERRISADGEPQVEMVTTPFYHPILPLVHDTNLASQCNPGMPLPSPPFSSPEDARAQVQKGIKEFEKDFGHAPAGMWPGEGAVAEAIIPHFQEEGIRWVASGPEVGGRSGHFGDATLMYRIDKDTEYIDHDGPGGTTDNSDAMSIVFRTIHDKIGFDYGAVRGGLDGEAAARDFLNNVNGVQHSGGVPGKEDFLVTSLADGENCWTYYSHNGRDFLKALYGHLNKQDMGIATTTPSIFAKKHPIDFQWELEPLAVGSWVGGELSTWIGEPSENDAWDRLRLTREALIKAVVPRPDPKAPPPDPAKDRKAYMTWKAWESLYAAEGSDWFWWFGDDQGDNGPFDARFSVLFRSHLINAFTFAQKAGYQLPPPDIQRQPLDASKETLPIPPVTLDPSVSLAEVSPGDELTLRIKGGSFAKGKDPTGSDNSIKEILLDLTPLGVKEPLAFQKGSDEAYSLTFRIPESAAPGKKLLTAWASGSNGARSSDFFSFEVKGKK